MTRPGPGPGRRPPPPARSRALPWGLALVAVYAGVSLATALVGNHRVRPLFDGFSPPPPYRWVKPPQQFAHGNVVPTPNTAELGFVNGQSEPAGLQSSDGQVVVNLGAGAVPPHDGDTKVRATLTPLDPGTLGPTPAPLRPDGNAYRIELAYVPSNQAVAALASPGNVFVTVPEPADRVLFSADGGTWEPLDTRAVAGPTVVGAAFARPGVYLGAASGTPATSSTPASSPGGSLVVPIVLIAASALALGLAPMVWRRVRRARRAPPGRQ